MAPFVPTNVINEVVVKIVDIAGKEHDVTVIQRETGFTARSVLVDEPGRSFVSADEAVQRLLQTINDNHPKQFELMEPEKQTQLLTWIKLYCRKGSRGNTKRWNSYQFKETIGSAIGFSIGNGELKGAMQAAGLAPMKDCLEYDTNWYFVLERNPRFWSSVWRLASHKIQNTNVDHHVSFFNSFRLGLPSYFSKLLMFLSSDPEENSTKLEGYVPCRQINFPQFKHQAIQTDS